MSKSATVTQGPVVKVLETGEIDPRELVIDEAANGRRFPAKVDEMAQSLMVNGQEQPIRVVKTDGKLSVRFGFRRARAALYIIENKLAKSFDLRYELVDMSDAEAFLHNMVENKDREDTTIVDDAANYLRLTQEPFSMSQRDIAVRLKVSDALVSRALSLVRGTKDRPALSPKILKLGHTGRIAAETLYELVGMEEDERNRYVDKVLAGGKVTASDAKQGKKKKKGGGASENQGRALTAKAIRLPFEEVVTKWPEGEEQTTYVQVCDVLTKFCVGALTAKGALRKIRELVDD